MGTHFMTRKPVPEGYSELKEGQARILQKDGNTVFYNEAQVTNRDLSIGVLRHFLPILAKVTNRDLSIEVLRHFLPILAKVTNRDLSIAVLRHFLPILAKEKADGLIKKRSYPKQQLQEKRAADAAGPSSTEDKKDSTEGEASKDESKPMEPPGAVILEGLAASGLRSIRYALEGLAASGLRSIRYALEIPGVARIDANDLDSSVCASMRQNCEFNGPEVQAKVRTLCNDARLVMMQNHQIWPTCAATTVSPAGPTMAASPSTVHTTTKGLFAFSWYKRYITPLLSLSIDFYIRIFVQITVSSELYKRYITPLLSLSIDFYIRIFVRVTTSPHIVKDSACKLAYLWQSSGCDSFHLQRVAQKKVG
eukprot:gene5932-33506_t